MGWVGDKVTKCVHAIAATDLPLRRAIHVYAGDLRTLVDLGVSYGRISEGLAIAGVLGPKTGRPIEPRLLARMLRSAPKNTPPVSVSKPIDAAPTSAVQSRPARGLEALTVRNRTKATL